MEFLNQWDLKSQKTPYFYFDKGILNKNIKNYSKKKFQNYYSTKSCLFNGLVKEISKNLDGLTVSSVNYLKRVRKETNKPIHFISPLIREYEIKQINKLGNSLTFNSLEQFNRFKKIVNSHVKKFIRIDPEISFIKEQRLNPSKEFSQLGVPLSQLTNKNCKIEGLHFHNNRREKNDKNIIKVMNLIENQLKNQLCNFQYINLGGGYLWSEDFINNLNILQIKWKKKYGITFIIEPGFDISNSAGFLISSVVDLFKRNSKNIAILDTSVNHLPDIFSFQQRPKLINHHQRHPHPYILAGGTCLAGDFFGEFRFKHKLSLGDLVIFKDVGAYSLVKANQFNGIEIPKIYMK